MLEVVARPRIVQPDPRLRRVAARRGWPILDWRSADGAVALADR
jgi:phosphoserine phosphatase